MRIRQVDLRRAFDLLAGFSSRVTWSQVAGGLWVGAGSEVECAVVALGSPLVEVAHLRPEVTTDFGFLEEPEVQVEVSSEGVLLAGKVEVRFLSSSSPRLLLGPSSFEVGQGKEFGAELVASSDVGLDGVTDGPVFRVVSGGWEELVGSNVCVRRKA